MAEWVISANTADDYDVIAAFNELDKIEWHEVSNAHIEAGDIVYIYVSNITELRFKCKVNKTGITIQNLKIDDRRFYKSKEFAEKNTSDESQTFMELELLEKLDGSMYKRQDLLLFGFPNNMQGRRKVSDVLHAYFEIIQLKSFPEIHCDDVDFVWLSVALLSYSKYNNDKKLRWPFYYFRQADIIKCCRVFFNKEINGAQCSQWANADHSSHTKNYLRGTLPKISPERSGRFEFRRLTTLDESFENLENPEKTYPSDIDPEIQISGIKVADLLNFIKNDYPKVFKTDIDYISILNHIKNNGNKDYQDREKCKNENDKSRFSELRAKSEKVCIDFNKIPELLCNPIISITSTLSTYQKCEYTDSSNTKISDYLCVRMRDKKNPVSVSIFAQFDQKEPQNTCFRVCLETDDNLNDSSEKMESYHSLLKFKITNPELVYVSGRNCDHDLVIEGQDSDSIRKKLDNRSVSRIQVCKYIRQKPNQTNEYFEYEIAQAVRDLMSYYNRVDGNEMSEFEMNENVDTCLNNGSVENTVNYPKNLILYGPPGTGKTYNSVIYAVAICEGKSVDTLKQEVYSEILKRYRKYTEEGRIAFTTFHQSYGYEEFIEGIKPRLSDDNNENNKSLDYILEDGLFKKFCLNAKDISLNSDSFTTPAKSKIWGMYLGGAGNSSIKTECFNNNEIRIGFRDISDEDIDVTATNNAVARQMINSFINEMEIGDIVLIAENIKHIDAIGIITGDYEYEDSREDYSRKRNVKWLVKGESHDISAILPGNRKQLSPRTLFSLDCLTKDDIKKLLPDSLNIEVKRDTSPRVFIIDEINRGNISKIFGELITLIEEPKREGALEEMHAILPYSKQEFAVPNNVYILGTMNTADRSIALMDTALRRRFDFEEMLPDIGVLSSLGVGKISFDGPDELDLSLMLDTMNKRIAYLFDREHTIGHAFFAKLANNQNIETLAEIFKKKIIPLLQEYFYDDYEKIQLVLGDNDKPNENKFVIDEKIEIQNIFKGTPGIDLSENEKTYRINDDNDYAAFKNVKSYVLIYKN